jgi:YYY domain-containing protein
LTDVTAGASKSRSNRPPASPAFDADRVHKRFIRPCRSLVVMEFGLVALWLAVFLLLGLLALPASAWLLPGSGSAALGFPLALAVLGVVGHLVGQVAFGWPSVLAGLTALCGVSYLAAGRTDPDWRRFAGAAGVFTAAFLLVVGIRAVDPAAAPLPLAIGEKFLDFGLLRSLERAPALPPEDMWFAGEPVRYYYGGHMLAALLATLTDTGGRFAYNLALSGFFATLVTGAYGLAGSIAAPYGASRRVAAGFGAFLVGVAGNLETATRVLVWLLPEGVAGPLAGLAGLGEGAVAWRPGDFWYFEASRVVPVDPSAADPFMAATEFPLFSWLNGDLHAHMMSQSVMLAVCALLLAYWRAAGDPGRRAGILLGFLPPVAGFLGVTNVWSFPTAAGLALLVVAFAPGDPADLLAIVGVAGLRSRLPGWLDPREGRVAEELRRFGLAAAATVLVVVLAVVWTLPFWIGVIPGGPGKSVAFWAPWSPLGSLVLVHGAFLAAFAPYLARPLGLDTGRPWAVWAAGAGFLAVAVLLGAPALGFVVPLGIGGWWLLRTREDAGLEVVLLLAGAAVVLVVELLTIEGERFNVIFKAYSQVWLLWAVAAGVALARLTDGWPGTAVVADRARLRTAGRALAALLVVSTSLYAGLALPAHFGAGSPTAEARGPTLDATAYLETGQVEAVHGVDYRPEAPAIRWLDAREGRPTIVTAAPGGYYWRPAEGDGSSAPASLTGLPTLLGWFHEEQYRGTAPYERRLAAVEGIYGGDPARQRDLLARYDVEYVYVGPVERATYDVTVDDLDAVEPVKEWTEVTIYEVDRSAL